MTKPLWLPSVSSSARSLACPASVVLPREKHHAAPTTDQLKGSLLHYYLERLIDPRCTADEAWWAETRLKFPGLSSNDFESLRDTCHRVNFNDILGEAEVLATEPAFAYHPETSTARLLGTSIERQYLQAGWHPTEEIPGSADLVILSRYGLFVVDYKTGHYDAQVSYAWLPQLKTLALMAARYYGVSEVRIAVCLVLDSGRVRFTEGHTLDALDLDAHAETLRQGVARWHEAKAMLDAGQVPQTRTGPWCDYCPSRALCPAWGLLARQFASGALDLGADKISSLTPKEAGAAWEKYQILEGILESVGKQLRAKALSQYLELSDGSRLGMVQCQREDLDDEAVVALVRETYGEEAVTRIAEWKVTKASLTRGLGQDEARSLIEELRRRGAVKRVQYHQLKQVPGGKEGR